MMRENLTWPKRMVFALTIFSLFFGAGNLIFPPYLAFQAGENITKAFPGFAITAILFPILGLVSVAKAEGIDNLSSRVGKTFSFLFTLVVYLAIGPCLAIPRTASTSYEMFASAISADNKVIEAVYSIAFFSLAALFSLRPEKLAEKLGKVLSPALLTLLLILFLSSMAIYPEDAVMDIHQNYSAAPFFQGFLDGYQTMDAAAALVFGMVVVLNAKTLSEGRNVDLVREEAKSGFDVDDLKRDFSQIISLENIKVEGLMNIAPIAPEEELHRLFEGMRELKEQLESDFSYELKELSMGMSSDYKIALEHGSTMIRIGRKLFL